MGRPLNDLTGMRFGKLTVIGLSDEVYIEPKTGYCRKKWFCECDCGNTISVVGGDLTKQTGGTRSCGCLLSDSKRKTNIIDIENYEYGVGWTNNTNQKFYFDLEDYDKIKNYCWYEEVDNTGYHTLMARVVGTNKSIKMSHLLGFANYDHKDQNPLNNRKNNFRECTKYENAANRSLFKNNKSGFTGVYFKRSNNKWVAQITVQNNQIYLGQFENKTDAIKTRLKAEVEYFGEFAPQKHLFKEYGIYYNERGDSNE